MEKHRLLPHDGFQVTSCWFPSQQIRRVTVMTFPPQPGAKTCFSGGQRLAFCKLGEGRAHPYFSTSLMVWQERRNVWGMASQGNAATLQCGGFIHCLQVAGNSRTVPSVSINAYVCYSISAAGFWWWATCSRLLTVGLEAPIDANLLLPPQNSTFFRVW